MRDTVFISHANPENNYFASWLAPKLRLLGYKVWVDVSDIQPGQYFNKNYEHIIRDSAIRFLAVVSTDYLIKSKREDSGVMNEVLIARTIKDIDGFIIPLHYDNCNYNEFTGGIIGRLAIEFNNNWGAGLQELLQYFEKSNLPKSEVNNNPIKFWYEAQKIKATPLDKIERYFTNWFPIELPEEIYIHKPDILIENEFATMPFNYIREGDRIISFVSKSTLESYTNVSRSACYSTTDFFGSEILTVDETFDLIEPNKKLVKLLNKIFKSFLFKQGLKRYEQANKKEIFYYTDSKENGSYINLKQLGKSRRKIIGPAGDNKWHFAISHSAALFPSSCFRIYYHLVFIDGNNKLLNSDEQHELRRSVPSGWYNRKWLETLMAFMLKVATFDVDNKIKIEVDTHTILKVGVLPIDIISEKGYIDPNLEEDEIEASVL